MASCKYSCQATATSCSCSSCRSRGLSLGENRVLLVVLASRTYLRLQGDRMATLASPRLSPPRFAHLVLFRHTTIGLAVIGIFTACFSGGGTRQLGESPATSV